MNKAEAIFLGWQVRQYVDSYYDGEGSNTPIMAYILIPPDATPEQREWPEDHFFPWYDTEDKAWAAIVPQSNTIS